MSRLAIPVAALVVLAGSAVQAQNRGPAQLSRDPSGRTTFGQSTLPFGNGGVGAGGAGLAFGAQAAQGPFGTGFGFGPTTGLNGFNGFNGVNPNTGFNGFVPNGFGGFVPNNGFGGFVPNNGFNGFNGAAGFNTFNPNAGFVDPRMAGSANPFANGFNPNFPGTGFGPTTGAVTGFDAFGNPLFGSALGGTAQFGVGNGFFDPFASNFGFIPGIAAAPYGGGFYGPWGGAYSANNPGFGQTLDPSQGVRANIPGRGGVPFLGVNTPPLGTNGFRPAPPGGRFLVRTDPKTPEDYDRLRRVQVRESVAGSREEIRGDSDADLGTSYEGQQGVGPETGTGAEIRRAPATRDQVTLAQRAQALMAERPMREGLIVQIAGKNIIVRYECKGERKTEPFPSDEVFFFRGNGELATAEKQRADLQVGDRVLVPCEEENTPRQSVAGSRQESRSNGHDHGINNNSSRGGSTMRNGTTTPRSGAGTGRVRPSRRDRGNVNSQGEK